MVADDDVVGIDAVGHDQAAALDLSAQPRVAEDVHARAGLLVGDQARGGDQG